MQIGDQGSQLASLPIILIRPIIPITPITPILPDLLRHLKSMSQHPAPHRVLQEVDPGIAIEINDILLGMLFGNPDSDIHRHSNIAVEHPAKDQIDSPFLDLNEILTFE